MRRAAALVLGTLAGTGLLVGAKIGNASTGGSPTAANANAGGVVVVGGDGSNPTAAASGQPASTAHPTGKSAAPGGTPTPGVTPKPGGTSTPAGGTTTTPTGTHTTAHATPTPTPTPAPTTPPPTSTTYTASATVAHNRGTLSMTVTISAGKITKITASETNPSEPNCYHSACNTLTPEALSAQSASINTVSGATYTSDAYRAALTAILGKV